MVIIERVTARIAQQRIGVDRIPIQATRAKAANDLRHGLSYSGIRSGAGS